MAGWTKMRHGLAAVLLMGGAVAAAAAAPPPVPPVAPADAALLAVVDAFFAARLAYDPVAIAATITDDYVEVSPVGDVDPRDAMLGFHAPAKRQPVPAMTTSERSVRRHGDSGIVLMRVAFRMTGPGGVVRERAMRAGYMMRREGGRWRIAAVQLTPMR